MIEYYKELLNYIYGKSFNKEYAKDITQETFSRVLRRSDLDTVENKRALLYRIAKNIMVDFYREKTKVNEVSFHEEEYITLDNSTENKVFEDERNKQLLEEIHNLPKKRRQAFTLHIIQGYSREEVAQIMGISFNAVEQHISRASNQIKNNICKKEDSSFE